MCTLFQNFYGINKKEREMEGIRFSGMDGGRGEGRGGFTYPKIYVFWDLPHRVGRAVREETYYFLLLDVWLSYTSLPCRQL
jgi:hypothetical protein